MNKKEMIILVVVFISISLITSLSIYFLYNKDGTKKIDNNKSNQEEINVLKVKDYSLKYGEYKGIYEEYDYDNDKVIKEEKTIILTKDTINNETYSVKDNSLYVNNYEMYKVSANNKIVLLAGAGVEFEYVEK